MTVLQKNKSLKKSSKFNKHSKNVKNSRKTNKKLKTYSGGATGAPSSGLYKQTSRKQNNNTIKKIDYYITQYITNEKEDLRIYLHPFINQIKEIALYYNSNNLDFNIKSIKIFLDKVFDDKTYNNNNLRTEFEKYQTPEMRNLKTVIDKYSIEETRL